MKATEEDVNVNSSSASRSAYVAKRILNGLHGDYLEATSNELALAMTFYQGGKPIDLSSLLEQEGNSSNKICVLVHGLMDDESAWSYDNGDYGQFLLRDLKITPFYLRYNTGLHISTNGRKLNTLMETLLKIYPSQEVIFLCHSMGGLVARSACLYGLEQNQTWVRKVSRVVFLGTPHQGSHWEKAGNVVSYALGSIPRPYMKLAADVANLRSAGIKDLRFGFVHDKDWQGEDPDLLLHNTKKTSALLDWASYHVITGTVTQDPNHVISWCLGDALVRKQSAEGRSDNEEHHLSFPPENFREFAGFSHNRLSRDPAIYEQIKEWVNRPWEAPPPALEDEITLTLSPMDQDQPAQQTPPGKWAQCKGLTTLVQDAVGNGATAVEGVQQALTSETYSLLSRITPIAPAVKSVQVVHEATVAGVYGIIRAVNYGSCEATKRVFEEMDKRERVKREKSEERASNARPTSDVLGLTE